MAIHLHASNDDNLHAFLALKDLQFVRQGALLVGVDENILEESGGYEMTANTENSGNTETKGNIEVIGRMFVFDFGPSAIYQLHFVDKEHREVTVMADAAYPPGTLNKFDIEMTQLRPNVYLVTWVEPATVTR